MSWIFMPYVPGAGFKSLPLLLSQQEVQRETVSVTEGLFNLFISPLVLLQVLQVQMPQALLHALHLQKG